MIRFQRCGLALEVRRDSHLKFIKAIVIDAQISTTDRTGPVQVIVGKREDCREVMACTHVGGEGR